MATTTPAPVSRSQRVPLIFRIISAVSLVLVALFLAGVGWFYYLAKSSLPELDGALQVAGLAQPVTVVRDAQGVPHITAGSLADLFFAQGYVTAQDRLWQLEATRRYAAGELAEVLGEGFLASDRTQRLLMTRVVAERAATALPPRDRADLEAYARGVNAYLESHRDRLPMEFRVLRYQPRPWTVADSLLVGIFMNQLLNHGPFATELQKEKILAKLGPELTAELYPATSWRDRVPGAAAAPEPAAATEPVVGARAAAVFAGLLNAPAEAAPMPGSNNWVVSGAHTVSGKPLLSNDMHLPHQVPAIWYEAHLRVKDPAQPPAAVRSDPRINEAWAEYELARRYDVAGITLPGLPYVIVGHNQRIAWGFTNLGPDVEDVVIEKFNDQGEYLTPRGWKQPERLREVIKVKGKSDVTLEVLVTEHGPIITDALAGETRKLALHWAIYEPDAFTVPFAAVNAAHDWEEFRRAFAEFRAPGQNVVYADADGHIGYQATGRVPIRRRGDGSLPARGDNGDADWKGYIPFEQMPSLFDPPSGIIATANSRVTPDGYPHLITTNWMAPQRTQRIYQVLESGKKLAPVDMLALQMDIYSDFDLFCAQQLAAAVERSKNASERARAAAGLLRAWDGRVRAEQAAPTIVHFARMQLLGLILEPQLGPLAAHYQYWMSSVFLEDVMRRRPQRWLPEKYAGYDELLLAALERTVTAPQAPRDLAAWRWGQLFPVTVKHPIFGRTPIIRRWAGPGPVPQSGSGFTVKQVGPTFGPSQRMTVDFSDLDRSTLNIVTGQSGHILSPHFMDQWDAWYTGRTFPLPFSEAAVAAARKHALRLEPTR